MQHQDRKEISERNSFVRRNMRLCSAVSVLALAAGFAPQAMAQGEETAPVEQVVVSASRITAAGFNAPTPTTVLSSAVLEQNAQPNIFDTITQLPSLQGSTGTQAATGSTSNGNNALSSFNLRNLGTIRTLTLIDGQRVVGAYVTGINDVSEFPQLLIQRVDVVTGGASASWGSDAVGGVINFVTDKNFNGIKGNLQGGMSSYGDTATGLAQIAAGSGFLNGRAHIEASLEFYRADGLQSTNRPFGDLPNGRCCNYHTQMASYNLNAVPPGSPQFYSFSPAQPNTTSEYGLINSGPLKGLAFHQNGTLTPFNYGSPCIGQYCVGGDLTNTTIKTSIEDPITRTVFYTRASYNLTPDVEVYGTYTFGNVWSMNTPGMTPISSLKIGCDNYYLSASVKSACTTNYGSNASSAYPSGYMPLGVSWDQFPQIKGSYLRQMRRYVIGSDGDFDMFGKHWTFASYAEHGETSTSIHYHNIINIPHYNAALDAVAGPNGTAVCRNPVAQAAGCIPFQIFGGVPISQDALRWIDPWQNGPYSLSHQRQEMLSISVNGAPFKSWTGEDVALAFGAEYREEAYNTVGDPYGDGVSAANPYTANYPADPLLSTGGNNWRAGNYHHGSGNYHVAEAFAEVGLPVMNSNQWGKADLDLAGRATEYSTSGYVSTWKVGLNWETPIDGVRLRTLQSRDVRAPNLSELFAAPITTDNRVIDRTLPAGAPTVEYLNVAGGNPNLKPETAQTTQLGFVYQPDYIPGLNMSVDYYRVAVKKEIGTISAQQIVDLCQLQNNTSFCNTFNLHGSFGTATPSYVNVIPFNLASTTTDGFDIEATYQFNMQDWGVGLPGSWVVRALANHVSKFIVDSGVKGQPITESAGGYGIDPGVPLWKLYLVQSWSNGPLSFNLTERFFSNGVQNPYGIVCQAPSCPVSTAQNPTYNGYGSMRVPGSLFLDLGGSYQFENGMQAYFKVDNVNDKLAGPIAGYGDDPIGRVFRIGVRINN